MYHPDVGSVPKAEVAKILHYVNLQEYTRTTRHFLQTVVLLSVVLSHKR